ncbi:MAG: energy-converting hydrogenase B subunit D [Candidatus Azotimanducaceae bacterium]|jgi:energy-converting hydrogenase B subunit D
MGFDLFIDSCLVFGILTLACLCLGSKNLFTAIILFISLGLIVTMAWVRLDAPDLAIAEAAIGAGLTGALLLATWRQLRVEPASSDADTVRKSGGHDVSNR